MPLTALQCRKAKPKEKDYSVADDDGLFLIVRATGGKSWLGDFVRQGARHKLTYGRYPEISLDHARKLHAAARALAETGKKPADVLGSNLARQMIGDGYRLAEVEAAIIEDSQRQTLAARITFAEAASRFKTGWVDHNWKSPDKGFAPVRNHLLPPLGDLALEDIDAPMLRELFYGIRERRGTQAALHAHGWCSRIFAYALEHDWCKQNPAQAIKAARIGTKSKRERWLRPQEIRRYLAGLYQADCYRGYKLALHLLLMLALRKGELCGASWAEFDIDNGEWLIPAGRMKSSREHRVFLPAQAITMLQELKRLASSSEWVMPMPTNLKRPMHSNNLNGAHQAAIIAADIDDYVIHDHRHTASTLLREQGHPPEVVETALSHAIPGMAGTYSHAQYKTQRLAMLQSWADFLDSVMNEQTVIQATFRKTA